jgi:hypothetical protein
MKFAVVLLSLVSVVLAQSCGKVTSDGQTLTGAITIATATTNNALSIVTEAVAKAKAEADAAAQAVTEAQAIASTAVTSRNCVYGEAVAKSSAIAQAFARALASASASARAIASASADAHAVGKALAEVAADSCTCPSPAKKILDSTSSAISEIGSKTKAVQSVIATANQHIVRIAKAVVDVSSIAAAKAGPSCAGCK